jgi:serine/threonine-protein kinase
VDRAVALDPRSAEVRAALGFVLLSCHLDASGAEAELRRAVAINPSYVLAHCWLGWALICQGQMEKAIEAFGRAQELDPLSPYVQAGAGHVLMLADRHQEAVAQLEKAAEIDADYLLTLFALGGARVRLGRHEEGVSALERAALLAGRASFYLAWLGWAYACAGRRTDAEALLRELQERTRTEYVAPPFFAMIHAGLGEPDRAFLWLERGYAERNGLMMWLRWPVWSSLRSDPRYGELLKRLGLAG